MASQSHATTVARQSPDGVTRAWMWHEDAFPSDAVLALIEDLEECEGFTETKSKITERCGSDNERTCVLESRDTAMSADIMRVLAYHNVALDLRHKPWGVDYIEYRVGFPVE